jgi:hypothetical protein
MGKLGEVIVDPMQRAMSRSVGFRPLHGRPAAGSLLRRTAVRPAARVQCV